MAKGLRELVRSGEMHPDDAIKTVEGGPGLPSPWFLNWCKGTGRKRYAEAIKKKTAPKEETSEEEGDEPKPKKKGKKGKKGKKSKG